MDAHDQEREEEIRKVFQDLGLPDTDSFPTLGHIRAWSQFKAKQEQVFFEYDTNTARSKGDDDAELE